MDDETQSPGGNGTPLTGRWTDEEHALFEKGLELYNKDWKKIAAMIPTRSIVQIRTHAQKYFLKQHKAMGNPDASPVMKTVPTPAEVFQQLEGFMLATGAGSAQSSPAFGAIASPSSAAESATSPGRGSGTKRLTLRQQAKLNAAAEGGAAATMSRSASASSLAAFDLNGQQQYQQQQLQYLQSGSSASSTSTAVLGRHSPALGPAMSSVVSNSSSGSSGGSTISVFPTAAAAAAAFFDSSHPRGYVVGGNSNNGGLIDGLRSSTGGGAGTSTSRSSVAGSEGSGGSGGTQLRARIVQRSGMKLRMKLSDGDEAAGVEEEDGEGGPMTSAMMPMVMAHHHHQPQFDAANGFHAAAYHAATAVASISGGNDGGHVARHFYSQRLPHPLGGEISSLAGDSDHEDSGHNSDDDDNLSVAARAAATTTEGLNLDARAGVSYAGGGPIDVASTAPGQYPLPGTSFAGVHRAASGGHLAQSRSSGALVDVNAFGGSGNSNSSSSNNYSSSPHAPAGAQAIDMNAFAAASAAATGTVLAALAAVQQQAAGLSGGGVNSGSSSFLAGLQAFGGINNSNIFGAIAAAANNSAGISGAEMPLQQLQQAQAQAQSVGWPSLPSSSSSSALHAAEANSGSSSSSSIAAASMMATGAGSPALAGMTSAVGLRGSSQSMASHGSGSRMIVTQLYDSAGGALSGSSGSGSGGSLSPSMQSAQSLRIGVSGSSGSGAASVGSRTPPVVLSRAASAVQLAQQQQQMQQQGAVTTSPVHAQAGVYASAAVGPNGLPLRLQRSASPVVQYAMSGSSQPAVTSPLARLYRTSADDFDDVDAGTSALSRRGSAANLHGGAAVDADSVLSDLDADVAGLAIKSAPGTPLHLGVSLGASPVPAGLPAGSNGGRNSGMGSRKGSSFYLSRVSSTGSMHHPHAASGSHSPKPTLMSGSGGGVITGSPKRPLPGPEAMPAPSPTRSPVAGAGGGVMTSPQGYTSVASAAAGHYANFELGAGVLSSAITAAAPGLLQGGAADGSIHGAIADEGSAKRQRTGMGSVSRSQSSHQLQQQPQPVLHGMAGGQFSHAAPAAGAPQPPSQGHVTVVSASESMGLSASSHAGSSAGSGGDERVDSWFDMTSVLTSRGGGNMMMPTSDVTDVTPISAAAALLNSNDTGSGDAVLPGGHLHHHHAHPDLNMSVDFGGGMRQPVVVAATAPANAASTSLFDPDAFLS